MNKKELLRGAVIGALVTGAVAKDDPKPQAPPARTESPWADGGWATLLFLTFVPLILLGGALCMLWIVVMGVYVLVTGG